MSETGESGRPDAHSFEIRAARERLEAGDGGYEVVHRSPSLEIGVYVLVAPEPDRQQPHEDDEVYVVLEGRGVLEVEGESFELSAGQAAFVPAGADHRFVGYEQLSLLVVFEKSGAKNEVTANATSLSTPGPGDSEGGDVF